MSDVGDAFLEARVKIKKIAASMLVRREGLEAEVAELEKERAEILVEVESLAGDPGADLETDVVAVLAELETRLTTKREELASAEQDYEGALKEMRDLGKEAKGAERAQLRAIVDSARSSDPLSMSPEDRALANVRGHAAELEGRVTLEADMATERKQSRVEAEARARIQLAELKAKMKKPSTGDGGGGGGDEGGGGGPVSPPKKRTL